MSTAAAHAATDEELAARIAKLEQLRRLRLAEAMEREPWIPFEHQIAPSGDWYLWLLLAGRGCVAAGTRIYDPAADAHVPVEDRTDPGWVLTTAGPRIASASYLKGHAPLYRVETETGDAVVVTSQHRFLTPTGWVPLGQMSNGSVIASDGSGVSNEDVPHSMRIDAGSRDDCPSCSHSRDLRPHPAGGNVPSSPRLPGDAPRCSCSACVLQLDESGRESAHSLLAPSDAPLCRSRFSPDELWGLDEGSRLRPCALEQLRRVDRGWLQFLRRNVSRQAPGFDPEVLRRFDSGLAAPRYRGEVGCPVPAVVEQSFVENRRSSRPVLSALLPPDRRRRSHRLASVVWTRIRTITPSGYGEFYDLTVPGEAHYLAEGLWHHNSGKTDACASYFDQFMRAHPGARGGIAAPTLGDAAEACVFGPSGLIAHNPLVKFTTHAGGTFVRWPNGSTAQLFGAYTKQDVERFRARGNRHIYWCPRRGTPVVTGRGEIPIEEVVAGDQVITRDGWRSVTAAACTGWRSLWRLRTADGRMLEATPEHPIHTASGWVTLESLAPGDIVTVWTGSSTTECAGTGVKMGTTDSQPEVCSTATSGSERSARSPQGCSSTTETETRATTISETSNLLLASSTPPTIPSLTNTPLVGELLWPLGHQSSHDSRVSALSVEQTSSQSGHERSTALLDALSAGHDPRLQSTALSAARHSQCERTIPREVEGSFAPAVVVACEPIDCEDWVWDLVVEDHPEFIAGGMLVHNCEELAAWRYLREAWENMELGLRQGVNPHIIASTTPKTRPYLKRLMESHDTVLTRATIHDNPKLPEITRTRLINRYGGTRLEAQELLGEYLDEVEGALWTYETIAKHRVREGDVPDLARVVVAVDPSGGDEDGNDEQGIIVAGRGVDGDAYVVADRSCKLSPDGWARRAVLAYDEHKADRILGETNFGGDLVIYTVKVAAQQMGIEVATKKLTASRGKIARAEPISALYEQGRVHHVGEFPELESQMRNWTDDSGWSPDRMDALVWALTELMVTGRDGRTGTSAVPTGVIPGVPQRQRNIR